MAVTAVEVQDIIERFIEGSGNGTFTKTFKTNGKGMEMQELTYVVAPAYNNIEIVLMAFPSKEQAETHLRELSLVPKTEVPGHEELNQNNYYSYVLWGGKYIPLSKALDKDSTQAQKLRDGLFANGQYYGGCGECWTVKLVTRPIGTPVVAFDLD